MLVEISFELLQCRVQRLETDAGVRGRAIFSAKLSNFPQGIAGRIVFHHHHLNRIPNLPNLGGAIGVFAHGRFQAS